MDSNGRDFKCDETKIMWYKSHCLEHFTAMKQEISSGYIEITRITIEPFSAMKQDFLVDFQGYETEIAIEHFSAMKQALLVDFPGY